jgi:6,7-dimethyl-8-ribityllumazine synthase
VSRELQGGLRGEGLRIAIVVARFNDFITSKLLDGARAALERHGVADNDVTVVSVPGSFEIPLAAKKLAESGDHHAVICLGAVIRGETDHYEHVAGEAAKGIAAASLASGRPVIFGVLTTDTLEQAINRAGGKQGNNGYAAGLAAIEMANLMTALDGGA